jgi:hypothetical protein
MHFNQLPASNLQKTISQFTYAYILEHVWKHTKQEKIVDLEQRIHHRVHVTTTTDLYRYFYWWARLSYGV